MGTCSTELSRNDAAADRTYAIEAGADPELLRALRADRDAFAAWRASMTSLRAPFAA